jgi:hypothetical protein
MPVLHTVIDIGPYDEQPKGRTPGGSGVSHGAAAGAGGRLVQLGYGVHQKRALTTFVTDELSVPGRFNRMELHGIELILDYGHNPAALAALGQAVRALEPRRTIMAITLPGDRRCAISRRSCKAGSLGPFFGAKPAIAALDVNGDNSCVTGVFADVVELAATLAHNGLDRPPGAQLVGRSDAASLRTGLAGRCRRGVGKHIRIVERLANAAQHHDRDDNQYDYVDPAAAALRLEHFFSSSLRFLGSWLGPRQGFFHCYLLLTAERRAAQLRLITR